MPDDLFAKYDDLKQPHYIPSPGGLRLGSGRHKHWKKSSYPLQRISIPPKLADALIKARQNNVDEAAMIKAISNITKR